MDNNDKQYSIRFNGREIILLVAAALITMAVTLAIYFAVFVGPYGAAMLSSENVRLKKAAEYSEKLRGEDMGKTVFFGDSITEMYDLERYFPQLSCVNRGIGGDTVKGLIARAETNLIALKPSRTVLLIGTNDLNKITPEETAADYRQLLELITGRLPETKLYVVSVLPIRVLDSPFSRAVVSNRTNDKIIALNAEIRNAVQQYDSEQVIFIDAFRSLYDGSALIRDYALDGLHINSRGYAALSAVLGQYLE